MNAMNNLDEKICEQLSAWMDGELSRDEAMFLERRLQHDAALQAMYSRLQMGSACMKGQSARFMPQTLCINIKQALAEDVSSKKTRKPLLVWAAAASMAFAAIVFVPGMMQDTTTSQQPSFTANSQTPIDSDATSVPTYASADLIANTTSVIDAPVIASSTITPSKVAPEGHSPSAETAALIESPENFPLNVSTGKKAWPRSPVNANSDPALEAYLVRHNQMMAQDGMGGFVPYVDVVAQDSEQAEQDIGETKGDNK